MSSADPRLNRRGQTHQATSNPQAPTTHQQQLSKPQPSAQPILDIALSPTSITDILVTLVNNTVDECFARKKRDFLLEQAKIATEEHLNAQKRFASIYPIVVEQAEDKSRKAENARDFAENIYRDHLKTHEITAQNFKTVVQASIDKIQHVNHDRRREDSNILNLQFQELRQKHEALEVEHKTLRDSRHEQDIRIKALEMEVKSLQSSPIPAPVPAPDPIILAKIADIENALQRLDQSTSQWENVKKALNLKIINLEELSKTADATISETKESLRLLATKNDLQTQAKKNASFDVFQSITLARLEKLEATEPVSAANDIESRALEMEQVKSELTEKAESSLQRHRAVVEGQYSETVRRHDDLEKRISLADKRSHDYAEMTSKLNRTLLDKCSTLSELQARISTLMKKSQSDTTLEGRVTEQEKELKRLVSQVGEAQGFSETRAQKIEIDLKATLSSWWMEASKTVPELEPFEALQARVLSLESSTEQLGAIGTQMAKLEHGLQELGNSREASKAALASIPDLHTHVRRIEEKIKSTPGQEAADKPTDKMSYQLESLRAMLGKQKEQLDQVDRVASAAVRAGLSGEDRSTLERTKGVDQRIERLEHAQQHQATRFDNLTTETLMRRMIGYLQPVLPKFELGLEQMETITGQVKTLEQEFGEMKDSNLEANTRYDGVAEQCKVIESGLEDCQRKIGRIEDGQVEMKEKVEQFSVAIDAGEVAAQKAHDDLAKRFSETRDEVVNDLGDLKQSRAAQGAAISDLEVTVKALGTSAKTILNGTGRPSQSVGPPSQQSNQRSTPLSTKVQPAKSKARISRPPVTRASWDARDESGSENREDHDDDDDKDDEGNEDDNSEELWDKAHIGIGRIYRRPGPRRVLREADAVPASGFRKTLASASSDQWMSTEINGSKRQMPETGFQDELRSPARRRRK